MNLSEEFLGKIKNCTALDFIDEIKIEDEFFKESIQVKNLYDGISILGNYTIYSLIRESIKSRISEHEKDIAICYKVFKYTEELSEFLIKYKSQLKQFVKNKAIDSFTLVENDNSIDFMQLDYKILYNNEGVSSLYSLKDALWDKILSSLEKIKTTEIVLTKLKNAIKEDYIEDINEIQKVFLNDYSKLNYDRIEELTENIKVLSDKKEILQEVEFYSRRYEYILHYIDPKFYTTFIGRNFYAGIYVNYYCISTIYQSELKEMFEDVNN